MSNYTLYGPDDRVIKVVRDKPNPMRKGKSPGHLIAMTDPDPTTGLVQFSQVYFAWQDMRGQFLTLASFLRMLLKAHHGIPSHLDFYVEALSDGKEHQEILDILYPALRDVLSIEFATAVIAELENRKDKLALYCKEVMEEESLIDNSTAILDN